MFGVQTDRCTGLTSPAHSPPHFLLPSHTSSAGHSRDQPHSAVPTANGMTSLRRQHDSVALKKKALEERQSLVQRRWERLKCTPLFRGKAGPPNGERALLVDLWKPRLEEQAGVRLCLQTLLRNLTPGAIRSQRAMMGHFPCTAGICDVWLRPAMPKIQLNTNLALFPIVPGDPSLVSHLFSAMREEHMLSMASPGVTISFWGLRQVNKCSCSWTFFSLLKNSVPSLLWCTPQKTSHSYKLISFLSKTGWILEEGLGLTPGLLALS